MEEGFYRCSQRLVKWVAQRYFPIHVVGIEWMPSKGGFLLAGNHLSFLDPPLIGSFIPRPIHFLMNEKFFAKPILHSLATALGALPVQGPKEQSSLRQSLRLLRQGEVVGIFPEGQRVNPGEQSPAAPGLGFLSRVGKVPVVPLQISGTDQSMPRGASWPRRFPVDIRLGKPIPPPSSRKEEISFAQHVLKEVLDL